MTVQNPNDIDLNAAAGNASGQSNGGTQQPRQMNVAGIITTFGGRSRLAAADAEVSKVQNVFNEFFEKNQNDAILKSYRTVTVSSQQTGNFGALVLSNTRLINGVTAIFVSTMIVEKSRPQALEPSQQQIGNTTVDIFVGPADAYTDNFLVQVSDEVKRQHGKSDATIIDCGYQIIYDLTPLEADQFQPVIDEAINAIDHAMDMVNADRNIFGLNLIMNNPAIRVRSRVALDQYKTEPNGLPIRSDIRTELVIAQLSNSRAPIADNSEVRLCETSAYVDLIYTPPATQYQQYGQNYQAGQFIQPHYIPRIVMTNFSVDLPHSSLEFMLLGVASMASLARQRAYGVVWRGGFGGTQSNLRNLGAVGLQVPGLSPDGQAAILDVSADIRELYALMDTVLAPSPVFTLEIEQGGQGNWATSIFARAAQGNQNAQELLVNAADNLTNHNFSKVYAQLSNGVAQPLITTTDDLSYVGYYNRDGEYRDIRELDLLAILNTVGQKDPQLVQDYLTTLCSPEHVHVRLFRRNRILQRIAKDVHIKAYSKKYDFSAIFIEALTRSVAACGLVINNDNILTNNDQLVYNQTIQNWQANMVNPSAVNPLFQTAQQQVPHMNFQVGNLFGQGFGF